MKNKSKFLALLCATLLSVGAWAATDVTSFCRYQLVSGNSKPLMTWETNHQGDVIITLEDGTGSTHTRFRGNGMSDGLSTFYIVNAQKGDQKEAKYYFTSELIANQFILRRRQDVAWPSGGYYIKFYDKYVQWLCDENNNAAQQVNCYFPYGDICGTLAQPVVSNLATDGTITFGAVDGATSYVARVYLDKELMLEQTIVSGGKINYNAWKTATHEVTVQALSADNYSKESVGTNWSLTGDLSNLPKSKFCGTDYMMTQPNVTTANAYVQIETIKGKNSAKDTVVFTISDATETETPNAYWRSNGLNQNGLLYDGKTFTNYFQLVESPASKTKIRYVKKDAATVEFGKYITYNIGVNAQSAEWATSKNNNASANTMSFKYIYGTNCEEPEPPTPPVVDKPTITAIANNVITFTGVNGASQYNLRVHNSSDVEVYTQSNITSGATINYYCYETETLKVYVDAIVNSETKSSNAYSWNVTKQVPVISGISDWVITFAGTQCADSYNLRVLDGETLMHSQNGITSGATINFADYHTRTYSVYVDAIKDSNVKSTSLVYNWALVNPDERPVSEHCSDTLSHSNTNILLTWETNYVGDVEMRMADGKNTTNAVARGSEGLGKLDWFTVYSTSKGDESASTYFTWEYQGDGATTAALRKKSGVTLPDGAIIKYTNHPIQWKCDQANNPALTITWNYTYGSSCANLSMPKNLSVAQDGTITFSSVAGATSYTARVYNETSTDLLHEQVVGSGDKLTFKAYEDGNYKVTIQATNTSGGYSDESAPVTWVLQGSIEDLPESSVCDKLIHQDNTPASYAYISINTDKETGIFTISIAPSSAYFRSGSYVSETGLKYNGSALTDYFTRTILDGGKKLQYTPKENAQVQYGRKITFNKYGENAQIEWYIGANRNSPNLSFEYIYGTECNVLLDETKDNAPVLAMYNGQTKKVLFNRSFIADGYWYTLCLPFSLTAEQLAAAYGDGYDLRYLESSYMKSEDMMYLNFEKATELEAGMPYMFKPTGTSNENYGAKTFTGVVIDNKTPENETDVATMTGYYSPMTIAETDYALGTDDYLYHTDGTTSNAFRCYFTLNPPTSAPVRARCVFNDSHIVTNLDSNRFTDSPVDQFTKFIYNGRLVIIRDGKMYNAQGVRL